MPVRQVKNRAVHIERGRAAGAASSRGASGPPAPTRSNRRDRYEKSSGRAAALPAAGDRTAAPTPLRLTLRSRVELERGLASGLAEVGRGRFAFVDDDRGIYLCRPDGSAEKVLSAKDDDRLRDLEGLCCSSDGNALYAVAERERKVYRLPIERSRGQLRLGEPEKIGKLPRLNDPDLNKGWEGISVMPGRFFDDGQDRLLACNEGNPRRLCLARLPDLDQTLLLKLPKPAREQLADLSDVAVDPRTGRVLVLSDQSAAIAEFALVNKRTLAPGKLLDAAALELIAVHPVPTGKDEKPEGLTFDRDGTLWLSTDGAPALYAFDVER